MLVHYCRIFLAAMARNKLNKTARPLLSPQGLNLLTQSFAKTSDIASPRETRAPKHHPAAPKTSCVLALCASTPRGQTNLTTPESHPNEADTRTACTGSQGAIFVKHFTCWPGASVVPPQLGDPECADRLTVDFFEGKKAINSEVYS